jgi:hypothetical protein
MKLLLPGIGTAPRVMIFAAIRGITQTISTIGPVIMAMYAHAGVESVQSRKKG